MTEDNKYRRKPQHEAELVSELGKLQPQDLPMEEAVLGACMLEAEAYGVVSDILKPEYFYDSSNQVIYSAFVALAASQRPIDMLTVTEQLRNDGTLEQAGGPLRIGELTGRVSSAANVEYHARIILQKYIARSLIHFSSEIQQMAFDESIDVQDLMQKAEADLFGISQITLKRDVIQIDPIIQEALKKIEDAANNPGGLSGLQTGYHELDKITNGWQNSDLIIIAARPAMGKTAFVLSMAKNMAVDFATPVAVFSLEMSRLQLVYRLISNVCELRSDKIKSGQLSSLEWDNLTTRTKSLYSAPIYIDDTPSLSVFELQTKARRLKSDKNIGLIIIDYLQLMNASGMKFGSREQEVSKISRNLKGLAKELDIPIIALSQLNRNLESREDKHKRPQLSDLRESGAIEQDADIVCFIHRPEVALRSSEDSEGNDIRGLAEFIIAKHRSGSIGTIKLRFKGEYTRFENWDDNYNLAEMADSVIQSKMNIDPGQSSAGTPLPLDAPPIDSVNFIDNDADNFPF